MRPARGTIQAAAATAVVMLLLISGAVFAYSPRLPLMNALGTNTVSPLDDSNSQGNNTHTSSCGNADHGQGNSATCSSSTDSETTQRSTSAETSGGGNEANSQSQNGKGQIGQELNFRIVPVNEGKGQGQATVHIQGTTLDVNVEIEKTGKSTQYSVALVSLPVPPTTTGAISSTTITTTSTITNSILCSTDSIGLLVTNRPGNGHAHLQATLSPGTYAVGIYLCVDDVPKLVTSPITLTVVIASKTAAGESSSATRTQEAKANSVQQVTGDQNDENAIKHQVENMTIPAVVSTSNSGSAVNVLDSRFSVSEGKLANNGLVISISADNVTGPRVILVNLTGASSFDLSTHSLNVTLDGNPVSEASSLGQVLNASPSDPSRFIILVTSSGVQLLVSIPHFSFHTIEILPIATAVQSFLAVSGPVLAASVLAATGAIAALYSKRKRI